MSPVVYGTLLFTAVTNFAECSLLYVFKFFKVCHFQIVNGCGIVEVCVLSICGVRVSSKHVRCVYVCNVSEYKVCFLNMWGWCVLGCVYILQVGVCLHGI